jgi:serine/threonine protein kinase
MTTLATLKGRRTGEGSFKKTVQFGIILPRILFMGFRVPAPDGSKAGDGRPRLVLPDGTILKKSYELQYMTSGGMNVIYKARKGKELFIIKEVDSRDGPGVVALTQEMSLLQRLDHPGIIKVFDLFEEDGFLFLLEEFIDGASLDRLIAPDAEFLNEGVILDWALQLYDIFDYLHGQKPPIIYRDLKPQNIMKDRGGRIHLVDFGLARIKRDDQFSDTMKMGTAATASPEHYGGRQTDIRSDIYTIGATLHMLLARGRGSGRKLFHFEPIRAINLKVPESFEKALTKALEIAPDDRFQTVDEMRQATMKSLKELSPPPGREKAPMDETDSFVSKSGLVFTVETPEEKRARIQKERHSSLLVAGGALVLVLVFAVIIVFAAMAGRHRKGAGQPSSALNERPSWSLPLSMRGNPDGAKPSFSPAAGGPAAQASPSVTPDAAPPEPFFIVIDDPSSGGSAKVPVTAPSLPGQGSYPQAGEPRERPRPAPESTTRETPLVAPPPPLKDIDWFMLSKEQMIARLLHKDERNIFKPKGKQVEGGLLFTSESDPYYDMIIPDGYVQLSDRKGAVQFANLDRSEGKESMRMLRVCLINFAIRSSEDNYDEMVAKYINGLNNAGAKVERDFRLVEPPRISHVFEYTYLSPAFGRPMFFREQAIPGHLGGIYVLTTSAAPQSYKKYEAEFSLFSQSFYAQGQNSFAAGSQPMKPMPPKR